VLHSVVSTFTAHRLDCINTYCFVSSCLQLVEEWEPLEYQRHIDVVEAALTAAVQDAMGDTRTAGRAAFAAYAANMPERANALLRRMDSGLQQKLTTAVAQYAAGHNLMGGEDIQKVTILQAEVSVLMLHVQDSYEHPMQPKYDVALQRRKQPT
jgi:hypothetical protein